jgi:hypothetical protein
MYGTGDCRGRTYSFFRRRGRVGTNFIFWVPALVVSDGILARLAIAFPVCDGPGAPDMVVCAEGDLCYPRDDSDLLIRGVVALSAEPRHSHPHGW